jgi:hypothetical protein
MKVEDMMCIESCRKSGGGREGVRVMEGVEWTRIKYTHSEDTLRIPFEH